MNLGATLPLPTDIAAQPSAAELAKRGQIE
jgi:hypothetical protein